MSCKRTARRPPPRARVTIDSLAFGGDGVGRDLDGRVTFVPDTAPGDDVDVELEEQKKGYARGKALRVLRSSDARVEPSCPLVPECGGCQWQHVSLAAQHAAKVDIVRRALRRVLAPESLAPIVAPSPPLGWRRRARLRWRRLRPDAPAIIGYAARRSHHLVDVATCPQLEPALDAALAAVRAALGMSLAGSGELELLVSRSGRVHVVVDGTASPIAEAAAALVGQAGIAGVILRQPFQVFGDELIDLEDGATPFWSGADLFAQASAGGSRALRDLVLAAAAPLDGASVLELHAGSGNFTRDLAAHSAHVVAVEEVVAASRLAARNLAGLNVELRAVTAEAALAEAGHHDVVVVDPPRTGLEPGLPARIATCATPARIVYVSCDPATLARDLEAFAAAGYRTERATPLDLMPQTFHVEVVALLVPSPTADPAGG